MVTHQLLLQVEHGGSQVGVHVRLICLITTVATSSSSSSSPSLPFLLLLLCFLALTKVLLVSVLEFGSEGGGVGKGEGVWCDASMRWVRTLQSPKHLPWLATLHEMLALW